MHNTFLHRYFLAGLLLLSFAWLPVMATASPMKVVYHISEGEQVLRAFGNIRNQLRSEPDTRIVVVALGNGVDFLLEGEKDKNGRPFADGVAALSAMGVQFRVCNNTLVGMRVDPARLLLEAKLVTSGVVEITRLQTREGYAYLRP